MKLEFNLKKQDVYTIESVESKMLVLAGEIGKKGYCLEGMIYNTATPFHGVSLKNIHNGNSIEIESNLQDNFTCPYNTNPYNKEIELITIDFIDYVAGKRVITCLKRFYYLKYTSVVTDSYNRAVSMLKKKNSRGKQAYEEPLTIPVTKNNIKFIRKIKGFKTIKAENVKVRVFNSTGMFQFKKYVITNTKTGKEKSFVLSDK